MKMGIYDLVQRVSHEEGELLKHLVKRRVKVLKQREVLENLITNVLDEFFYSYEKEVVFLSDEILVQRTLEVLRLECERKVLS